MTDAGWIVAAVAMCLMGVDWWSLRRDRPGVEAIVKPAVMVALIGVVLASDVDPARATPWLLFALAMGLVGDIVLLPRIDRFIVGLASFLIGHLAYVAVFVVLWDPDALVLVGLAGAVTTVIGFGRPVERALRESSLRWPVVAYTCVTIVVVLTGAATGRWLVAVGTLSFAASDGLLGLDRFVTPRPRSRMWVHVFYQLGQMLIVVGVVAG